MGANADGGVVILGWSICGFAVVTGVMVSGWTRTLNGRNIERKSITICGKYQRNSPTFESSRSFPKEIIWLSLRPQLHLSATVCCHLIHPMENQAAQDVDGGEKKKRHHHHHHHQRHDEGRRESSRRHKHHTKKKKSSCDKSKQQHTASNNEEDQMALLEERIRDKQRTAATLAASINNGSNIRGVSAAENAATLDARINAKRAANGGMGAAPTFSTAVASGDGSEDELDYEKSEQEKEDDIIEANVSPRTTQDSFSEEGGSGRAGGDDESYYPTIEADQGIMAEINQEGLVDEAGGIQAFVADAVVDEANVIGVIKSDDEVETEERREYTRFFLMSVACLVFLIIVIAVPVTLKATNVISKKVVLTPPPTLSPTMMPSESPSSMPSSVYFTEVVEKLYPLSGERLNDVGSPQFRAAKWIADEDPMRMDLDDPGFEQRYVMAAFYYAMDGPNWSTKTGWLGEGSECDWFGVEGPGCNDGCVDDGEYRKVCGLKFGMFTYAIFAPQYCLSDLFDATFNSLQVNTME